MTFFLLFFLKLFAIIIFQYRRHLPLHILHRVISVSMVIISMKLHRNTTQSLWRVSAKTPVFKWTGQKHLKRKKQQLIIQQNQVECYVISNHLSGRKRLGNLVTDEKKKRLNHRNVFHLTNVESTMDRLCEKRGSFKDRNDKGSVANNQKETADILRTNNRGRRLGKFDTHMDQHIRRSRLYQCITYWQSLSKQIPEQRSWVVNDEVLLKLRTGGKLWKFVIIHVQKGHGT